MTDEKNALRLVRDETPGDASQREGIDSSGVVASGESEQALLVAGKISVDEYMDLTVDRTLSHLEGQVSGQRLQMMRSVLRQELEQDPHLAALVQRVASAG